MKSSLRSPSFPLPLQGRKMWNLEREIIFLGPVCMPPTVCTDVFQLMPTKYQLRIALQ